MSPHGILIMSRSYSDNVPIIFQYCFTVSLAQSAVRKKYPAGLPQWESVPLRVTCFWVSWEPRSMRPVVTRPAVCYPMCPEDQRLKFLEPQWNKGGGGSHFHGNSDSTPFPPHPLDLWNACSPRMSISEEPLQGQASSITTTTRRRRRRRKRSTCWRRVQLGGGFPWCASALGHVWPGGRPGKQWSHSHHTLSPSWSAAAGAVGFLQGN